MKNWTLLFFAVLIFGCAQDRIPKPNPFMKEEHMIDFLVDLSIANASRSFKDTPNVPMDSLYAYHGIDSITFANNNLYYVSKPKVYTKIFTEVEQRIDDLMEVDSTIQLLPTKLRE